MSVVVSCYDDVCCTIATLFNLSYRLRSCGQEDCMCLSSGLFFGVLGL